MPSKLLAWPSREECVALLAGFGAGVPIPLLTGSAVRDGLIESIPPLLAAIWVTTAVIMYLVATQVNGSIVWDSGDPA
jgi:hypothetical protein